MTEQDLPAFQGYPSNVSVSVAASPDPENVNQGEDSQTPQDTNVDRTAIADALSAASQKHIVSTPSLSKWTNTASRKSRKFWLSTCGCRCRFAEIYTLRYRK